jgi:hypothetical protein
MTAKPQVDTGLQMLFGTDGETATQGLDGLGDRCKKYYQQGARFGACDFALFLLCVVTGKSMRIRTETIRGLVASSP